MKKTIFFLILAFNHATATATATAQGSCGDGLDASLPREMSEVADCSSIRRCQRPQDVASFLYYFENWRERYINLQNRAEQVSAVLQGTNLDAAQILGCPMRTLIAPALSEGRSDIESCAGRLGHVVTQIFQEGVSQRAGWVARSVVEAISDSESSSFERGTSLFDKTFSISEANDTTINDPFARGNMAACVGRQNTLIAFVAPAPPYPRAAVRAEVRRLAGSRRLEREVADAAMTERLADRQQRSERLGYVTALLDRVQQRLTASGANCVDVIRDELSNNPVPGPGRQSVTLKSVLESYPASKPLLEHLISAGDCATIGGMIGDFSTFFTSLRRLRNVRGLNGPQGYFGVLESASGALQQAIRRRYETMQSGGAGREGMIARLQSLFRAQCQELGNDVTTICDARQCPSQSSLYRVLGLRRYGMRSSDQNVCEFQGQANVNPFPEGNRANGWVAAFQEGLDMTRALECRGYNQWLWGRCRPDIHLPLDSSAGNNLNSDPQAMRDCMVQSGNDYGSFCRQNREDDEACYMYRFTQALEVGGNLAHADESNSYLGRGAGASRMASRNADGVFNLDSAQRPDRPMPVVAMSTRSSQFTVAPSQQPMGHQSSVVPGAAPFIPQETRGERRQRAEAEPATQQTVLEAARSESTARTAFVQAVQALPAQPTPPALDEIRRLERLWAERLAALEDERRRLREPAPVTIQPENLSRAAGGRVGVGAVGEGQAFASSGRAYGGGAVRERGGSAPEEWNQAAQAIARISPVIHPSSGVGGSSDVPRINLVEGGSSAPTSSGMNFYVLTPDRAVVDVKSYIESSPEGRRILDEVRGKPFVVFLNDKYWRVTSEGGSLAVVETPAPSAEMNELAVMRYASLVQALDQSATQR